MSSGFASFFVLTLNAENVTGGALLADLVIELNDAEDELARFACRPGDKIGIFADLVEHAVVRRVRLGVVVEREMNAVGALLNDRKIAANDGTVRGGEEVEDEPSVGRSGNAIEEALLGGPVPTDRGGDRDAFRRVITVDTGSERLVRLVEISSLEYLRRVEVITVRRDLTELGRARRMSRPWIRRESVTRSSARDRPVPEQSRQIGRRSSDCRAG